MEPSDIFPEHVLGHSKGSNRRSNDQPDKKAPKPRPPQLLRDKIPLYGKLPKYSGPYAVGMIDLEVPVRQPRSFSNIKREHVHAFTLETVLISVYYPAHFDSSNDEHIKKAASKHNARPTWLTRPRSITSAGYGRFAGLPEFPTMIWFLMTTWYTKLPVYRNARLADHWPKECQVWQNRRGGDRSIGNPPVVGPKKPIFPLILFSHGLGGTRRCYSSICGEFASHGFIVAAVEHRDGSGPSTIVNHTPVGPASRAAMEEAGHFKHKLEVRQRPFDLVETMFSAQDKHDTNLTHEIDHELREAQIQLRIAEIDEAYYVLQEIAEGRGSQVKKANLRTKGTAGASSLGLIGTDLCAGEGRIHIDNVTVVGHSFGSATAVAMMRRPEKYHYIKQGIIYDIWGMAIKDATPEHRIDRPILGINSEAFMYWAANFEVAKQICMEAAHAGQPSWLMTVRGTVHVSQSDFCILYPRIASVVMKARMDPVRAIDVNIDASLDFLSRVLSFDGEEQPFTRRLPKKKLLDLPLIDDVPIENKPKQKWTAVRLRIKHEWRKRLVPGHKKKYWEALKKKGGEEVWVHVAPPRSSNSGGHEIVETDCDHSQEHVFEQNDASD